MRWATGEDWNLVMEDLSSKDSYEGVEWIEDQTYDEMQRDGVLGWGSTISVPYFTTFVLIITFIAMNLTVAAVIDGLSSARKDEGALISTRDIDTFIELWSHYDPKATGWISIDCYVFLIFELPNTIGLGKQIPVEKTISIDLMYKSLKRQNHMESLIFNGENLHNSKFLHDCKDIQIIKDKGKYFYLIFRK